MNDCFLNGVFLPLAEASISPLDRGFLFADGIYEVIAVRNGRPFVYEEHYARLVNSLAFVMIDNPFDLCEFKRLLTTLIAKTNYDEAEIYLQITRGVGQTRQHSDTSKLMPTVFAMIAPFVFPSRQQLVKGVSAVSQADDRWQQCGEVKNIALLANILALYRGKALQADAVEVILLDGDAVQEGCSSSVVIQEGNQLVLPPYSPRLLRSITRALLTNLAQQQGIPIIERAITREQLYSADNVWLLSTKRGVMPVISIDDYAIGDQTPSELWYRIDDAYQQLKIV